MKFRAHIKQSQLVSLRSPEISRLLRHEYAKLGRWWHRVARPRHFTRGAFQRYPGVYKSRGKVYRRIKKKKTGHQNPLVLSGESKRASSNHKITATRNGVSISYPGLRKFNFKRKNSQVNMRAEFEAISASEVRQMESMMVRSIDRKLATAARNGGRLSLRG